MCSLISSVIEFQLIKSTLTKCYNHYFYTNEFSMNVGQIYVQCVGQIYASV